MKSVFFDLRLKFRRKLASLLLSRLGRLRMGDAADAVVEDARFHYVCSIVIRLKFYLPPFPRQD